MRGQMSGVFKLAYCRAVQRFEEFHDKLSLPAFDAGFDFIDFPDHGHIVRRFEFAFQSAALDPDTVKMNSLLRSDFKSSNASSIVALCASLRRRLAPFWRSFLFERRLLASSLLSIEQAGGVGTMWTWNLGAWVGGAAPDELQIS